MIKIAVILGLVAVLATTVSANTFYVIGDEVALRRVNNETAVTSTIAGSPPGKVQALTGFNTGVMPSLGKFAYNAVTKKVYAIAGNNNNVREYSFTSSTQWTAKVFAGSATNAAGAAEGTGTAAGFTDPTAIYAMASGDMLVADSSTAAFANPRIRKVTPAGVVTQLLGNVAAAYTHAVGTNAAFTGVISSMAATADGTLYVAENNAIRKIAPDMQSSRWVGTQAAVAAAAAVDGVGTAAEVSTNNQIAISKDEKTMWVIHPVSSEGVPIGGPASGVLPSLIRKVNMESLAVTTVAGGTTNPATATDGVGTNAIIGTVMDMYMDAAGNLVFTELGLNGGAVRKFDTTTNTVTTVASTVTLAALGSAAGAVGSGTAVTRTDGAADVATFVAPAGIIGLTEVCGKYYPEGADVAITADCEALEGNVPSVDISNSAVTVSNPLNVGGNAAIGTNGKLTASAATAIAGALALTGNGTFVVNGAAVTANSFAMGADSSYHILVDRATPLILTVANAASLAGNVVVCIASDYDFGVGSTASILAFGSRVGGFAKTYLIKLRTPLTRSTRSLLQASSASVACGATACTATGVQPGQDDDDEVPFLVALIIVSIALFVLVCAAIFFWAASKSRDGKPAAAVAADSDSFDYSSSSQFFGPQADAFGYDYDYSS